MNVYAVEGAAGTGKTHRILNHLAETLADHPLTPGRRVLALTFMHGSRRRLASRLLEVLGKSIPFDCSTFDSFAYRILVGWSSLARRLAITPGETYESACAAAGQLLEHVEVQSWVTLTHPIIVIDELQDLIEPRLAIVRGLASKSTLLAAADEFQCLQQALRPNPGMEWLRATCTPDVLVIPHRTKEQSLLFAAAEIRAGHPLPTGMNRSVFTPEGPGLAAFHLARILSTQRAKTVAVIYPSMTKYVRNVIERVQRASIGTKQRFGPHAIVHERRTQDDIREVQQSLNLPETIQIDALVNDMSANLPIGARKQAIQWVRRQHSLSGVVEFARDTVHEVLRRQVEARANFGGPATARISAMSIHQAKNREFEGVVVVWPYEVAGDDEQRRRLLYNAITRAREWCFIIVQNASLLDKPPFK